LQESRTDCKPRANNSFFRGEKRIEVVRKSVGIRIPIRDSFIRVAHQLFSEYAINNKGRVMNANFGLLPEAPARRKRDRKQQKAEAAREAVRRFAPAIP
jgi:folate-dependent tRNA-U54 methylase TrmFO/GidA